MLSVAAFWPSLFLLWFLGPIVSFFALAIRDNGCDQRSTREEIVAAAGESVLPLIVQSGLYAVPIACLAAMWNSAPGRVGSKRLHLCFGLFCAAIAVNALHVYGSALICGQPSAKFFSPFWSSVSFAPLLMLAINIPLYAIVIDVGSELSSRGLSSAVEDF